MFYRPCSTREVALVIGVVWACCGVLVVGGGVSWSGLLLLSLHGRGDLHATSILAEVMASKRELPKRERKNSGLDMLLRRTRANLTRRMKGSFPTRKLEENQAISGPSDDEEKQLESEHSDQIKSSNQANEQQNAKMEFREALLSLTLVICVKLINADDFDDEVARKISLGEGQFGGKLKAIVEENCEATAECLRIVKLCGQIALLMMERSQYIAHVKDQEFVRSLSKASKMMSNLESCMLFAGTDCGTKKTVKPLLSTLADKAHTLVGLQD